MNKFRIEKDALGKVKVPFNSYIGAFTTRSLKNFQISGLHISKFFQKALGIIKLTAAVTNEELKLLNPKFSKAILRASQEFIDGKFDKEFSLDVFQAGAGTPFNMNANEIIANRANELLGEKKGEYKYVNPNDHVNMSQSSNDVIPTAMCISILSASKNLLENIKKCESAFRKKAREFKNILKVGRTHLQDAVPITLGQEFEAYAETLNKDFTNMENSLKNLRKLNIGGTAIGTGINTDPKYKNLFIKNLNKYIKIKFSSEKNLIEATQNISKFVYFSSSLKALSLNLIRIVNDLKILNMGPKAGINEIDLYKAQPGSSIMPAKVNPSIVECLQMVCVQVVGNDHAVSMASQLGQLELNTMTPVAIFNILWSMEIMTNALKIFEELCVSKTKANIKNCKNLFENSLSTATVLNPYIGYRKTAEVVKRALQTGKSIKETVIEMNLLSKKELDEILSLEHMTKPYEIRKNTN